MNAPLFEPNRPVAVSPRRAKLPGDSEPTPCQRSHPNSSSSCRIYFLRHVVSGSRLAPGGEYASDPSCGG